MKRRHDSNASFALRRAISVLLAVGLLLMNLMPAVAAAPPASAEGGMLPTVTIFSSVVGEPTSSVPGFPGVTFTSFDRPFGSPNGNWIISADTDNPTTNDEVVLVNGVVKYFEGDPAPWLAGAENIGLTDTKLGINDAGEWAFANNTSGSVNDDFIVKVSATDVYTYVAREGDPIPALPAATYDDTLDTAVITADGTVGLSADGIDGVPTTEDDILVLGSTLFAQEGVTVPPGQIGTEFWDNFDIDEYWVSPDGSHWIANGDLTGDTTTDDVAVVDGTVVIQEGVILPGTTFTTPVDASGIVNVSMAPNGDWFARGNNDLTEQDWVYSNGALLAVGGDPIHTGATEFWDDTTFSDLFFLHVGDSFGNYVIGGVSSNPDPEADGVLVANNTAVVVRQGDPVDVDNNGLFDDNAFYDTFGNDDAFLTDAGIFYFVATLMDDSNASIGQGFFSVDITSILYPNTPPTMQNVAITSPIQENDSATLTGDIVDPDSGDDFVLEVSWGDGTVMTYSYPVGTTAFTETHQYLDDDPSGTSFDMYGVTLVLTDTAGATATAAVSVTVENVAPTANAGPDQTAIVSDTVDFSGSFTDPGTLDSHNVEWDFGDGNTISGTLTPTNTYTTRGYYTVTLTVTDDDTGVGSDTMVVAVGQTPTSVDIAGLEGNSGRSLSLVWLLALPAGLMLFLAYRRRQLQC